MRNLTSPEEFKIKGVAQEPHFSYIESSLVNRKEVSSSILRRDEGDILIIESFGFLIDSVFAGISEKQIEQIAKYGPSNYKRNILKIMQDKEMMKGVSEIVKAMDDDLGNKVTQNQERIKNVIQYIKDNRIAFEF